MFRFILSNYLLRVYAQKLPLSYFPRDNLSEPIRCGIFASRVTSSSATWTNFTFCLNFTLRQSLITHIICVLCTWFPRTRISLSWYVMTQLSTSVQQTMGIAALMPAVLTMWAASRVPVCLDTPEMDSPVQVSHFELTVIHKLQCDQYKSDSLCVTVILADHDHILTAHVCKRFRIFWCLFTNWLQIDLQVSFPCDVTIRRGIIRLICYRIWNCENDYALSHIRQFASRPTCV